jgi:hypothetical protein
MIDAVYCTAAAIVGAAYARWPRHGWKATKFSAKWAALIVFSPVLLILGMLVVIGG